jgi:hypothetical protein
VRSPTSTLITAPVVYEQASDARYSAAPMMSSGFPARCSGMASAAICSNAPTSQVFATSARNGPGPITFARTYEEIVGGGRQLPAAARQIALQGSRQRHGTRETAVSGVARPLGRRARRRATSSIAEVGWFGPDVAKRDNLPATRRFRDHALDHKGYASRYPKPGASGCDARTLRLRLAASRPQCEAQQR